MVPVDACITHMKGLVMALTRSIASDLHRKVDSYLIRLLRAADATRALEVPDTTIRNVEAAIDAFCASVRQCESRAYFRGVPPWMVTGIPTIKETCTCDICPHCDKPRK